MKWDAVSKPAGATKQSAYAAAGRKSAEFSRILVEGTSTGGVTRVATDNAAAAVELQRRARSER